MSTGVERKKTQKKQTGRRSTPLRASRLLASRMERVAAVLMALEKAFVLSCASSQAGSILSDVFGETIYPFLSV